MFLSNRLKRSRSERESPIRWRSDECKIRVKRCGLVLINNWYYALNSTDSPVPEEVKKSTDDDLKKEWFYTNIEQIVDGCLSSLCLSKLSDTVLPSILTFSTLEYLP